MTFDILVIGIVTSFVLYFIALMTLTFMRTFFVKQYIGKWFLLALELTWIYVIARMFMSPIGTIIGETIIAILIVHMLLLHSQKQTVQKVKLFPLRNIAYAVIALQCITRILNLF